MKKNPLLKTLKIKKNFFNNLILLMLFSFTSCQAQNKRTISEINLNNEKKIEISPDCKNTYLVQLNNLKNNKNIPYKIKIEEYNEDCFGQSNLSFLLESKNDSMYILNIFQFTIRYPIIDEIYFIKKNDYYIPKYVRQIGKSGSMIYYSPYKDSSITADTIKLLSNYRLKERKEGLETYSENKVEGRIIVDKKIDLSKVFNLDQKVMDYHYQYDCIYDNGESMKKEQYNNINVFVAEKKHLGEGFTCRLIGSDDDIYEYKSKIVTKKQWDNYVDSIGILNYQGF